MQFTFATLAVMATAVLATAPDSTVYQTEEVTITSCAPTVTVSSLSDLNSTRFLAKTTSRSNPNNLNRTAQPAPPSSP